MNNKVIDFEYFSLLIPPEGYSLAKAVGTTYSLDLRTALSIPLAFHFKNGVDPDLITDPFALFLSLKATANKIDIFCQRGGIHSGVKDNKLFRFIENSINEIGTGMDSAFHPKVWIIRFEKQGEFPKYRLISLSRNLTNDQSWDMSIAMDGDIKDVAEDSKTNKPLIDFVSYLYKKSGKQKPKRFLNDLEKVCFRPVGDEHFSKIKFLPFGIDQKRDGMQFMYENTNIRYEEIIVVSPFVTQSVLDNAIVKSKNRLTLVSRRSTFDELDQEKLKAVECWYINEKIVSGGGNIENEEGATVIPPPVGTATQRVAVYDLHAKVYLVQNNGEYSLYIGSANASHNAFNSNVEFMVRVDGIKNSAAKYFLKTYFFSQSKDFLVKYEPDLTLKKKPEEKREKELERYLAELCAAFSRMKAQCKIDVNSRYSITLSPAFEQNKSGFTAFVRPLSFGEQNQKSIIGICIFNHIELADVSVFFVITVTDPETKLEKSAIIKLEILDLPPQREEAVVRSMISNKAQLFRLLRMLLSDDIIESLGIEEDRAEGDGKKCKIFTDEDAIFEKLMMASSRKPEKLKEAKTIIEYLEHDISSNSVKNIDLERFVVFWKNFKTI